jgi:hypothetical protein
VCTYFLDSVKAVLKLKFLCDISDKHGYLYRKNLEDVLKAMKFSNLRGLSEYRKSDFVRSFTFAGTVF